MFPHLKLSILFVALFAVGLGASEAPSVNVIRTQDGGIQPQTEVDASGTVHLIYFKGEPSAGDIFYVRKGQGEKDFSTPIRVNTQRGSAMAVGNIRGAQLAMGKNGRVHVVWDGMGNGAAEVRFEGKRVTPLLYTRSLDKGSAFEPERNIINYAYGLDGGSSVAADLKGNVFVTWHAPRPGNTNGEAGRTVFVARSLDEGMTFGKEKVAGPENLGACGCCGMKAFADSYGNLFALYRGASTNGTRPGMLLLSADRGETFKTAYQHEWKIASCPMSSASLTEASGTVFAAAETHGRVFFVRVDPRTGAVSPPVSPEVKGKYPVVIGNKNDQILFVWAEGMAWNKGGQLAWQMFDREGKPTSEINHADGLSAWSLPTAYAGTDGSFTIIY